MEKRITIKNLVIQFDGNEENAVQQAQQVIDLINKAVEMADLGCQPQILSSGLDASDVEVDDNPEFE